MNIPAEIAISGQKVPSLTIALLLGLIYWIFIIWYEGRKDGFGNERILDLAFSSLILSGAVYFLLSYVLEYLAIFYPKSSILFFDSELLISGVCFLASLLPILIFSALWKWSGFRLLDIYAIAYSQLLIVISIGKLVIYQDINFLYLIFLIIILYLEVLRFRGYRYNSGVIFSIFLLFLTACGLLFFRRNGYLLFYGFLVTISMLNLILRRKKSMYRRNLPADLINALKSRLLRKDKDLRESQQLLVKEDPYLQEGRDVGNSEEMDEAILEDVQKEVTDQKMTLVKRLRIQVKRALAAIKIGKYGVCEVCGKPIDRARLQAYPEATACIDCANKVL